MPELIEFNIKAKRKPVAAVVGGLVLKEGKRYVTKGGTITGPMHSFGAGSFHATCNHNGTEGTWYWNGDGTFGGDWEPDYPMHIVKEYVEPTAFLLLEVGKIYVCRNGKYVKITHPAKHYPDHVMGHTVEGFATRRYVTATGKRAAYRDDPMHEWHIVGLKEELIEPSGTIVSEQRADELHEQKVSLEYQCLDGIGWSPFPTTYPTKPSKVAPGWKWRVK